MQQFTLSTWTKTFSQQPMCLSYQGASDIPGVKTFIIHLSGKNRERKGKFSHPHFKTVRICTTIVSYDEKYSSVAFTLTLFS